MNGLKSWFVIINPKAGSGKGLKKWPKIKSVLEKSNLTFEHRFTNHKGHSKLLVVNAINKGYVKFICVGGDGTLHHIVNGIMCQNHVSYIEISVGVIPIGTGNDWVKSYHIPKNIEQAVTVIKNGKKHSQDIGKISFLKSKKKPIYFMNLAGIGFDAYVAKKAEKLKMLGGLSYLVASLKGMFYFKNVNITVKTASESITTKSLMTLIGICRFSGGNMQLTNNPNPSDGLLDITIVGSITKFRIIKSLNKLYNGKINTLKEVKTLKSNLLDVSIKEGRFIKLQADGEVFNAEDIRITVAENAFYFYC